MFLEMQTFQGQCPTCHAELGCVPTTAVQTAYTPAARAMYRGSSGGHMVVLSGKVWLVMCQQDTDQAMRLAQVSPAPVAPRAPGNIVASGVKPGGKR